ncbi:hypothetical protein GPECTOR_42g826 [Gonium pectorale]|uniref:FAD-binding FR-type domain-containing protein n=1 Tax=Gonium pectorale TaxID=33097 RepID=A0A150GAL9_GONPE|nr:hypothetical protein GPECTOR_42g826 [Gonium pectorale]|eukprot:KXZ46615.1 hypothetical protein GPECTOR_42g826 [Gonium pectorale]
MAVAFAAVGLLWLELARRQSTPGERTREPSFGSKVASTVRRVLAYRVPPRGLWRALLGPGGLSLLDLFLILLCIAKFFGLLGRADLLLLFFPLARCNFLHWLIGADFSTLVKYHRWLGYGTILMFTLHGVTYLGWYSHEKLRMSDMLNWGMNGYPILYPGAGVNRLAGLIALIAGWGLVLGTIPAVRRRFFALWHASHVLAAVVFLIFGFMHRKDIAIFIMPGMFLYLLDVVLRTIQQNFNSTAVSASPDCTSAASHAVVSPNGSMLTLTLKCKEDLRFSGSDIVFLNAPSISWWTWHPFTVASSSASGSIVLHIKKHSGWTKSLIARLSSDAAPVKLHVSGPYHSANRQLLSRFDRYVFIAGGAGVTPVLGMLNELIAARQQLQQARAAAGSEGCEKGNDDPRVTLVWVSRSTDELSTLPDGVLHEASRGKDGWLDLQLFWTSSGSRDNQTAGTEEGDVINGATKAVVLHINRLPSATGATQDAARPLAHPYMLHPLLWVAAVILSFAGGFGGTMAYQVYDSHKARTVRYREDFSYVGLLQFAALGVGCTVGPAVLFLVAHIWSSADSLRFSTKPSASQVGIAAFLKTGRPEVAAILQGIASGDGGEAAALQAGRGVGVFVGGPPALVAAVDEACAALNGVWGRAGRVYLEPHILTQEL